MVHYSYVYDKFLIYISFHLIGMEGRRFDEVDEYFIDQRDVFIFRILKGFVLIWVEIRVRGTVKRSK